MNKKPTHRPGRSGPRLTSATEKGQTPPEVSVPTFAGNVAPAMPRGRFICGDLDIRIDREGVWYYHGSPIGRKELVCLFASVLTRAEDGSYWLVTPAEMGRVEVEDVPFMAVELFVNGCGREQKLSMRTNVDEIVSVDDDHPLTITSNPATEEPLPYVAVRDSMNARLSRSVYYQLVALGVEEKIDDDPIFGVWSCGSFFPMGRLSDEP